MELVFTRPEIGTFILLSGDSDFSSLVLKLKEYGKYVIGVGIRESASDLLVQNCDEYYSYNALAGLVKSGDEETKRWDPYELVAEAVQRMARNGDVMRADRLKQVMQDIDVAFDEKDLGMAKFSRFVTEAQHRGPAHRHPPRQRAVRDRPRPEARPARDPAAPPPDRASVEADIDTESVDAERDRGERLDRSRRRGRGPRPRPRRRARARPLPARGRRGRAGCGRGLGGRAPTRRPSPSSPSSGCSTARPRGRPSAPPSASPERAPAAPAIGVAGERLTRAEAFDVVRRAVESLTNPTTDAADATVGADAVRRRAFELLGRDSESLGDRMFERVLRDAHDANQIDLRRRGDSYELARASETESVADQLNRAAAAAQPAAAPAEAGPRGMGPRGLTRGRAGRGTAGPPPELLLLGAVQPAGAAPTHSLPAAADLVVAFPATDGAPPAAVETDAGAHVAALDATPRRRAARGRRARG
jgi:hypothetical protein